MKWIKYSCKQNVKDLSGSRTVSDWTALQSDVISKSSNENFSQCLYVMVTFILFLITIRGQMFKICSLKHAHPQKASDTEQCIETEFTQR